MFLLIYLLVFLFPLTPLPRDLVIRSRVSDLAVSCSDESYSHLFFIPLFSCLVSGLWTGDFFWMRQFEKGIGPSEPRRNIPDPLVSSRLTATNSTAASL